jgi:uncharacterized MnhB-related membrane protein
MILGALILAAWLALILGSVWMICLGILSHIFNAPDLAIGYWHSVVVAFIANLLLGIAARRGK